MTRRPARALLSLGLLLASCAASGRLHRDAARLNLRGATQLREGHLDDAEASFHLALEYNRRFAEPYNNLGLLALQRGRIVEARRRFREALERNRDFAEAWSNLGVALLRRAPDEEPGAQRDEAVWALREALEGNPGLLDARFNLARALLERGEVPQAMAQTRQLTQLAERDPLAWTLRAEAALRGNSLPEAEEASARAVALEPGAEQRLVRARVQLARGEVSDALADLRGLRGDARYGLLARALLAVGLLARGDVEDAAHELEGLEEQGDAGPTVRLAREALSAARRRRGPATARP